MTPNEIRQKMPVGKNVFVRMNDGAARMYVTVIEHFTDGVVVGLHPDMLSLPYEEIKEIS